MGEEGEGESLLANKLTGMYQSCTTINEPSSKFPLGEVPMYRTPKDQVTETGDTRTFELGFQEGSYLVYTPHFCTPHFELTLKETNEHAVPNK